MSIKHYDATKHNESVTNPEPKVSEKARELAALILYPHPMSVNNAAELIQSSLSELLEAGQALNRYIYARWGDTDATIQDFSKPFAAILSKWEKPNG